MKHEKCLLSIKLYLGEKLYADLKMMAAQRGYESLSPLIRILLCEKLYGESTPRQDLLAGLVRDE